MNNRLPFISFDREVDLRACINRKWA